MNAAAARRRWPPAAGDLAELARQLAADAVVVLPTDTLYGFSASPSSRPALERIWAAKGMPSPQPQVVLAAGAQQLAALGVVVLPRWREALTRLWPGPVTLVLPLAAALAAAAGEPSLAVRVPAGAALRDLLSACGPLTSTSCNRHGGAPLGDPAAIAAAFGDAVDIFYDAGPLPENRPSTIVDLCSGVPRLLRAGAYPAEVVAEALGTGFERL